MMEQQGRSFPVMVRMVARRPGLGENAMRRQKGRSLAIGCSPVVGENFVGEVVVLFSADEAELGRPWMQVGVTEAS